MNIRDAIDAFEGAVDELAFIGTIPLICDDAEEQRAADAERVRIINNYNRAYNRLIKLFEGANQ